MKKMSIVYNAFAFIMLILSSDVIMALEKTNLQNKKLKNHKNDKSSISKTEKQFISSTSSTPKVNDVLRASSSLVDQISVMDQTGNVLQNDPNASKSTNTTYTTCKNKFYNIISILPSNLQTAILAEFASNINANYCCDSEKLIKSVSNILNSQVSSFAQILTNQQQKSKKGFVCFRAPEIVAKDENLPFEKSYSDKNKEFINSLLLQQNVLSSNLLKCLNQINKISIRNLGLMCSSNEMSDKIFNLDAISKRYTSVKKFPDDDKNIYSDCIDYIKNYDTFSNTVLGAYVDSLNFLIGTDKCNYFSNLFTMDPIRDKNDPYLPKDLADLATSTNTSNSANNNLNKNNNNDPTLLLNSWYNCASTKTEINSSFSTNLKNSVIRAQYINPFGLSTYIGRADIDYQKVKQKFNLVNYPYYYLSCTMNDGCYASFKGASNQKQADMSTVITGQSTKLEVSCCNKICIVYVKIEDSFVDQNGNFYSSTKNLEAAEIFEMKSDRNSLELSSLDYLEIRNSRNCFNKNSSNPISFIEKSHNFSTQFVSSSNISTQNTNVNNPSSSTAINIEKNFDNSNFLKILNDLYLNPSLYENDFRLKTTTMLKVTLDGKTQTLNDLLYNDLFTNNNSTNYIQCEMGNCIFQQNVSGSPSSIPDKKFNLEQNNDKVSISIKTNVAMKKGGSSGGKSGSKSSSSKSSSSSSSGSSFSKSSSSSTSSSSGSSFSKPSSTSSSNSFSNPSNSFSSSTGSSFKPSSTSNNINNNGFNSATTYGTPSYSSGNNGFNSATSYGTSKNTYGNSFNNNLYPTNKNNNNYNNNSINSNSNSYNTKSSSNSYFNQGNVNNYYYNNNYPSNSGSKYETKINVSSNPYSSFNSNYYNNLYSNNYGYNSLKVNINNPVSSISSYNYGYNTYNYNSYVSSVKFKDDKIKIKVNYYPSYTYNPIYSDIFYPYNRYYSYNYYSHYYRPNYYNYYYQNQNIYANNPATSGYSFNSLNLPADYNAEDWLPSYQPYFDRQAYIQNLNSNLSSVKIYSQCCKTWCAYVIQNINDGILSSNSKQRIYVEVILKNYAFFDSGSISASQKKCLIKNIQLNYDNPNSLKDNNIFQKCGINSPYDIIPVKQQCLKSMNEHCKANGFLDLMDKSAIYVQSSDESTKDCLPPTDCLNLTSSATEAQMQTCGASIISLFSTNSVKPSFKSFIYPCAQNTSVTKPAMIEKFMNKQFNNNSSTDNSNIINLNNFSSDQKAKLESIKTLAANQINSNISIDNNTALSANTNINYDSASLNLATDSAVASSILNPDVSDDGSYNNSNPYYKGGIYANGKINKYSNYITILMILFIILI